MLPDGVHLSDAYNCVGTHGIIGKSNLLSKFCSDEVDVNSLNSLLFETLQKQCQQFNTVATVLCIS